jgi:hypothetical protein
MGTRLTAKLSFTTATMLTIAVIVSVVSMGAMTACSPAQWRETQRQPQVAPVPFTGDPRAEKQTTPTRPGDLRPGQPVYTRPDRLCGHRLPQQGRCEPKDPIIEKGEKISVEDPTPQNGKIKCRREHDNSPVYIPPKYVSPEPPPVIQEEVRADRYFVVQNVATEKLRLYERCNGCGCKHRLILETEMVVGQDTSGRRTQVGSYSVQNWEKFYEDSQKKYLPWFSAELPNNPAPRASLEDWTGKGSNRGAFGWYTAIIGPDASEQWLHGTWGWGNDDDSARFISALHQPPLDQNPRVASHGCTRIENRAIAMLRELLSPGAKIIKIYAREGYRDTPAANTPIRTGKWRYALTTEVSEMAPHAGLRGVISRQVPQTDWLEQGVYQFQATAVAVPLSAAKNSHESGNAYKIPESSFKGQFLVDEGRLVDYQHPSELTVGGHVGQLPSVVLQQRCQRPSQPEPKPQPEPNDGNDGHNDEPVIGKF